MFSGLVTATSSALKVTEQNSLIELVLKRPEAYKKLKQGESIAVDGVCLTLKSFDTKSMTFDLALETLKVTGWTAEKLKNKIFNLEPSLTMQDALGGQVLTGHVDSVALVTQIKKEGESCLLSVEVPKAFKKFVSKKGYLALNGVSLTVNEIKNRTLEFCIIPETLRRTNLSQIKEGDFLNFEVDYNTRSALPLVESFYKKTILIFIILKLLILSVFVFLIFSKF